MAGAALHVLRDCLSDASWAQSHHQSLGAGGSTEVLQDAARLCLVRSPAAQLLM